MLEAEESSKAEHQYSKEGVMEYSSGSERTLRKADFLSI